MRDKEANGRPTAAGGTGGVELGMAPQETPNGKTPLSPLKEALCVAVIWVFIVGAPVLLLYNLYLLLLWIPIGGFLEDRWRKKYDVHYVSRRFTNWLTTSWFGEIFVRRCYVGSKVALKLRGLAQMGFMVGGLALFSWLYRSPPIELEEMRMVSGTLTGWKLQTARSGGCGDIITLRLKDGHSESFYKGRRAEDFYRQMEGQELTVWVQSNADAFLPNCRKFDNVTQLQHDGRIIGLPYDKERYEIVNSFIYHVAKYFIWTGLISLLLVWLINRRKNSQFESNKS